MEKLKNLIHSHYDLLVYLVFGGLTTLVDWVVYLPCYNLLQLSSALSNVIAWAAAVVFAYVTIKPFVFRSHDWSASVVLPELVKFVGTRLGSGGVATLILYVTVDSMGMNGYVWKIITSVGVIILNYIGSKLLVFRKK